jgi:hypothetical protein
MLYILKKFPQTKELGCPGSEAWLAGVPSPDEAMIESARKRGNKVRSTIMLIHTGPFRSLSSGPIFTRFV